VEQRPFCVRSLSTTAAKQR